MAPEEVLMLYLLDSFYNVLRIKETKSKELKYENHVSPVREY